MLQVFDQSSSLSPSQAVRMLKSITRSIAKDPEAYDLLTDPGATLGLVFRFLVESPEILNHRLHPTAVHLS
jgi:hypothetical protein